ncbi:MAG: transposase [Candidatus Brocadiaceae bacterium]|nr:transposase [Candidatus Brocadiaceae bacterium]
MAGRKKYVRLTGEEKVAAVRRHLVEKIPVSEIADNLHIHPNTYYEWQTQFFENGGSAFQREKKQSSAEQKKIISLEDKVAHKDQVISEIMSDFIALKKSLGEI